VVGSCEVPRRQWRESVCVRRSPRARRGCGSNLRPSRLGCYRTFHCSVACTTGQPGSRGSLQQSDIELDNRTMRRSTWIGRLGLVSFLCLPGPWSGLVWCRSLIPTLAGTCFFLPWIPPPHFQSTMPTLKIRICAPLSGKFLICHFHIYLRKRNKGRGRTQGPQGSQGSQGGGKRLIMATFTSAKTAKQLKVLSLRFRAACVVHGGTVVCGLCGLQDLDRGASNLPLRTSASRLPTLY